MRSASGKVKSGRQFWGIKSVTSDGRQKAGGEELGVKGGSPGWRCNVSLRTK